MEKATLNIPAADGKWGSYISKYPPDSGMVGNSSFTTGSRNLITAESGQAQKRQGGILWNPASILSGPALDQYEGVFSSGQRLLIVNDAGTLKASTGNGLFADIIDGTGFTNPANFEFVTYLDKIYGCNGVDAPIVIDVATSYGGVTYPAVPARISPMGLTAPTTAPTVGVPTAGGNVPVGSHTYAVTFLYYNDLEEGNLGPSSSVVVVANPNKTVPLTSIPIGGYGVNARNIYRDNNDGNYLLLDTITDNTTTTYTDVLAIGSTPTPAPRLNFGPSLFKYCILYLDRIFVIDITGKTISWSVAGQPDVFYPQNAISGPPDDIMTGFGMLNGLPYVFGQHTVGTILGTTDSSFYYNSISTRVGCVDNRTIQARLIVSVPKLIWLAALPNRGIYYTNGSTVEHLSDNIQDLTFNLAQISYLSGINSQSSLADFQGGTSSPAIDLTTNPGTIQTINPKAAYSRATDWTTGTLSNIAISGDQLEVPVANTFPLASGSLGGTTLLSGGNLTLPSVGVYTGESHSGGSLFPGDGHNNLNAPGSIVLQRVVTPFIPPQTGTLTGFTFTFNLFVAGGGGNWMMKVYSDSGGSPGTEIFSQDQFVPGSGAGYLLTTFTMSGSVACTGGSRYWVGVSANTSFGNTGIIDAYISSSDWSGGSNSYGASLSGTFAPIAASNHASPLGAVAGSLTFVATPIPKTGSWTSTIYDSRCSTQSAGMTLTVAGTYPTFTSGGLQLQGSANTLSWTATDNVANPSGTVSLTGGQFRYWRVIFNLSTTDNTNVPVIGTPTLQFNVIGTWTSPPIATTTDTTSLDSLTQLVMVPAGTSAVIEIATSPTSGSGYTSYGPIGSAVADAFAKIRVTLTASAGDITSPTLQSVEFDWSVTATFISSIADTGQVPNGWSIFQYELQTMTGTVVPSFRTASTSGGIPAAPWDTIANGGIPSSPVNEFFQYRLVLSGTADAIPQVGAVTTTWLISSGTNVRAASLFFNKSYYLAVATAGSTANDLLIEYDYQDNWRIHDGVNIGTMGTYFNDIFYCDALVGNVYNGFRSDTDNGVPITMRLRTKCFDLGNNLQMKTARSVKITGVNTGTFLTVSYSVDRGSTWNSMLNSSGTLGYQTASDGAQFIEYFIPLFDGSAQVSGRTIMYEIVSSDALPCAILQITPTVYVHRGKAVREAMVA